MFFCVTNVLLCWFSYNTYVKRKNVLVVFVCVSTLSLRVSLETFKQQGGNEHFGRYCPTKSCPSCCEMTLGRQSHVPAIMFNQSVLKC